MIPRTSQKWLKNQPTLTWRHTPPAKLHTQYFLVKWFSSTSDFLSYDLPAAFWSPELWPCRPFERSCINWQWRMMVLESSQQFTEHTMCCIFLQWQVCQVYFQTLALLFSIQAVGYRRDSETENLIRLRERWCVYHIECISFWDLNHSILVDRVTYYLSQKIVCHQNRELWVNDTGLNNVTQTLITRGRTCLIRFQTSSSSSPVWVENRLD